MLYYLAAFVGSRIPVTITDICQRCKAALTIVAKARGPR